MCNAEKGDDAPVGIHMPVDGARERVAKGGAFGSTESGRGLGYSGGRSKGDQGWVKQKWRLVKESVGLRMRNQCDDGEVDGMVLVDENGGGAWDGGIKTSVKLGRKRKWCG
ncbi:hypothetical protein R3P38DRAFT_2809447 [Favolaschia claudopus]|uniref:Uncharacterized protein n=1 Tax=Favolaschia claudopus TaxID=2862362 RepID=A0AAV9ZCV8_9AGAR